MSNGTISTRERHPQFTDMPPYCASCAQQKPGELYIDFDSAFDGPVLNREDGIAMQIDDLIICAACLREAANLLGLVDPDETAETLEKARRELLQLRDRLAESERYNDQLEKALEAKPGRTRRQEPKKPAPKRKAPHQDSEVQDAEDVGDKGSSAPDPGPGVVIERLT